MAGLYIHKQQLAGQIIGLVEIGIPRRAAIIQGKEYPPPNIAKARPAAG